MSSKPSWSPIDTTQAMDQVRSCSFLRVGDGTWVGGVTDADGHHFDIVETSRPGGSAWEVRQVGASAVAVSKGSTLELALEKALKAVGH